MLHNNDTTEDALLAGQVRLRQPARGYRVNLDTVLLAAALEIGAGARAMEAGCGVGGALLAAAWRCAEADFVGVEREPDYAALARENATLNGFEARVSIVEGDALDRGLEIGVFDAVFFNPPFDLEGEGRAPDAARRAAHIADAPLERWIAALADRLKGGGVLSLIQRASRLDEILAAFEGRLGGVEILPLYPRAGEPAKRVLARARKGSRAPLKLLGGHVLHDESGAKHRPEIEAVLRGESGLAWR